MSGYDPRNDLDLRLPNGRPTAWLCCILDHRDRIERRVRAISEVNKELIGYTAWQILGVSGPELVRRAHADLVQNYAPKNMWGDPVV